MLRWILVIAVISFLIGKWLCNKSVRSFRYGTKTGQRAMDSYSHDLNLCESEDEVDLMIKNQSLYWRQRRTGLFLQYAGVGLIIITVGSFALFTMGRIIDMFN